MTQVYKYTPAMSYQDRGGHHKYLFLKLLEILQESLRDASGLNLKQIVNSAGSAAGEARTAGTDPISIIQESIMNTKLRSTTLRSTTLRSTLTAAACLGVGLTCLATLADAAVEPPPTRVVRYADLDISREPGARVLYRRIQAAARQVCEGNVMSNVHLLGKEKACFNHAVDEAVQRVNSAALAQVYGSAMPRLASR
jgi:UrcA family protein